MNNFNFLCRSFLYATSLFGRQNREENGLFVKTEIYQYLGSFNSFSMFFPLKKKKCKNCFKSSIVHLACDKISLNLKVYIALKQPLLQAIAKSWETLSYSSF